MTTSTPGVPSDPTPIGHGLVLGGGGVSGIAWMIGLFRGLEESGAPALPAELVVGTSAGAAVAAQVTSGASMADLYERQVVPERQVRELTPDIKYLRLLLRLLPALPKMLRKDPRPLRTHVGQIARSSRTVDPAARRAVIEERLPRHEWPATRLLIVAADTQSGELHAFDRDSPADLVDAVAASCAVPAIWPTVHIQGRDYMDGGVPSPDNVAVANGVESLVVISPIGASKDGDLTKRLKRELAAAEAAGMRTFAIVPDPASRDAIGRNALDPSRRASAAQAGLEQGRAVASRLAEWLATGD